MVDMAEAKVTADCRVIERVSDFIVANFLFGDSSKKPGESDSLIGKGIVDSTGILELIEFIESEFGIEIREEETVPANLDSLAAMKRFIESKLTP
jgi:acyl carrier protein